MLAIGRSITTSARVDSNNIRPKSTSSNACSQAFCAKNFGQQVVRPDKDVKAGSHCGIAQSLLMLSCATSQHRLMLQAQAVELLCRCDDIPDDGIELRVLKGLLTAVTSNAVHVHGQALLLVRRASMPVQHA